MDQLVMTGLFPAGSKKRGGGEERREGGKEKGAQEKTGEERCQSRRGLQHRVIQGSPSSVFIRLPDRNHGRPPQMTQFTRDKLATLYTTCYTSTLYFSE